MNFFLSASSSSQHLEQGLSQSKPVGNLVTQPYGKDLKFLLVVKTKNFVLRSKSIYQALIYISQCSGSCGRYRMTAVCLVEHSPPSVLVPCKESRFSSEVGMVPAQVSDRVGYLESDLWDWPQSTTPSVLALLSPSLPVRGGHPAVFPPLHLYSSWEQAPGFSHCMGSTLKSQGNTNKSNRLKVQKILVLEPRV